MANASVDKLKALGLRHGEKAVVGLAAAVCVLLFVQAATQPTIDLTPDQVNQAAKTADANLNRRQQPEDVLKRIEDAGIKNPNFEKMVDEQMNNKLLAANYRVPNPWVTTEPGAGLLRDKPELIAPTDLYAYTGRGGALVFALDENGARIPDTGEKAASTESSRRRRKRRRPAAGGSSMMGQAAPRKKSRRNPAEAEKEKLEKYEEEVRKKAAIVTDVEKVKKKEEAEAPAEEGPFKEITKGLRWVSITGAIDYKKLRENYLAALKVASIAYPNFKQLDVERQTLNADGTWSDWQPVDVESNQKILNNIPEAEEELTSETSRIDLLVDPLPFLKAGYWERVHYAPLVEQAKIDVEKPKPAPKGSGMMGSSSYYAMQQQQMEMQNSAAMIPGSPPMGMSDYGMAPSMYGGGETIDFQHHDTDLLMIRSLDFTVEPEETYRYRLRIVVFNPNKDREDTSPGVDRKSEELTGPWSEPTDAVTVQADVATYAMSKTYSAKRNDQVHFQIAKWNSEDGVTVVRDFDAGPGDVLGEPRTTQVPNTEGEKAKSTLIDFNSHRLVLDVDGGNVALPTGMNGAPLSMPVISLLVRPDGQVVLHDQATDVHDDVRKDTDKNYRRELKESGKKRESSMGSYMMSGPRSR